MMRLRSGKMETCQRQITQACGVDNNYRLRAFQDKLGGAYVLTPKQLVERMPELEHFLSNNWALFPLPYYQYFSHKHLCRLNSQGLNEVSVWLPAKHTHANNNKLLLCGLLFSRRRPLRGNLHGAHVYQCSAPTVHALHA